MIYFITDGEYVKIGFTDKDDVASRFNDLQTGNARELHVLGTIPGDRSVEATLHKVFAPLRANGEWFAIKSKLIPEETPSQIQEIMIDYGVKKSRAYEIRAEQKAGKWNGNL